jgi:hypothetical protein
VGVPCRYTVEYLEAEDLGIPDEVLAARREREAASLASFVAKAGTVHTLSQVHQWLFVDHGAYVRSLLGGSLEPFCAG